MNTKTCERCGHTAGAEDSGRCPRCAERAVRAQMRRFAAVQAGHLRELRSVRAGAGTRTGAESR